MDNKRFVRPVLLIWEFDDKVITKPAMPIKSDMETKISGRKPSRMIVPDEAVDDRLKKLIKDNIAYNGLAITISGVPLYDKRKNTNERLSSNGLDSRYILKEKAD